MERITIKTWSLYLLVCFSCFLATASLAQITEEQEAKINAAARNAEEIAQNLPANEKKIAWFILERINKMIAENAKANPNVKKEYSLKDLPVDEYGRMHVNVSLLLSASSADTIIVKNKIKELGGSVRKINIPRIFYPIEIYCWIPYEAIKEVAKLPVLGNISSVGFGETRTGSVTTIGDFQLFAADARSYFQVNGSGIKVGVISDGIQHYSYSQSSGDLPSSLQWTHGDTPGDEGTAMLEIVYDMAPGASLAFGGVRLDGTEGPNDMKTRISELYHGNINCKVVVDDIGWFSGIPYFSQSDLMSEIEYEISSYGKTYISACGNEGLNSYDCVSNVDANGWHLFWNEGSSYYNSNYFSLGAGKTVKIYLQWANQWGNSNDNYDLYLFDRWGTEKAKSIEVQDGQGHNPAEKIEFTNAEQSDEIYHIRVKKVSASEDREFKLIIRPKGNEPELTLAYTYTNYKNETAPIRQIFSHPASMGAISVAAYYSNEQNQVADYSSRGPTNFYILGQPPYQEERHTPSITATSHVSTKVGQNGYFPEPFDGTSASAPHIAGIAALYFSKYPSDSPADFYNSLTQFASTLGDIGTGGTWNFQAGFGKANAFGTLAKSKTLPVTVTQVDNQSLPFGQVGVYENSSFVSYTVPATFAWLDGSIKTIRADQNFKPSTTQKYHDWNDLADVVNHRDFTISPTATELTAYFRNANNSTIQAQLIDGGNSGGSVQFKDPWLIDDNSDSKGPRNRGMNAIWYNQPSPFSPSTASNYKGVLLNENPTADPNRPIYKIRVAETQTINGFTSYFKNWTTTGASITQPSNLVGGYYESPVIFESAGSTVAAKYKAHMGAGAIQATSSNNGRRMVRDSNGKYHLVYESLGEIYYSYSTDNGSTWSAEQLLSDGQANNSNPSIEVDYSGYLHLVWAKKDGSEISIKYRRKTASGWESTQELTYNFESNYDPTPVISNAYDSKMGNEQLAVWKEATGLKYKLYEDGAWSSLQSVPSTNVNSNFPSLDAYRKNDDSHLCWQEGGEIYYRKYAHESSSPWSTPREQVSPDPWWLLECQHPSVAVDYSKRPNVTWDAGNDIVGMTYIYHRRRDSGGWGTMTEFATGGNDSEYPSIASYAGNNKLTIAFDRSGDIRRVNYISSWGSQTSLGQGHYPNISSGSSQAKIVWPQGTNAPYALTIGSSGLSKAMDDSLRYYRRADIDLEIADKAAEKPLFGGHCTIDLEALLVSDGKSEEKLAFTPIDSTTAWERMLDCQPFIASSKEQRLNILYTMRVRDFSSAEANFEKLEMPILTFAIANANDKSELAKYEAIKFSDLVGFNKATVDTALMTQLDLGSFVGKQVYVKVGLLSGKEPFITEVYDFGKDTHLAKERGIMQPSTLPPAVPQEFELSQNYPNPFNPETNIAYALPQAGHVRIEVYNILGQRIITLIDRQIPAGHHSVRWNGRNALGEKVSAGIYLCRMQAGEFVKTQKMTLLP